MDVRCEGWSSGQRSIGDGNGGRQDLRGRTRCLVVGGSTLGDGEVELLLVFHVAPRAAMLATFVIVGIWVGIQARVGELIHHVIRVLD